jgi:hypothetical protein
MPCGVIRIESDVSEEHIASIIRVDGHSLSPAPTGFLPGVLFTPLDRGNRFLRNDGLFPIYRELQLRRPFSSQSLPWAAYIVYINIIILFFHLSLRSFIQGIRPGSRLLVYFSNRLIFEGEEMLAPRPTPKLKHHPLSAVRGYLFNIFAAALQN